MAGSSRREQPDGGPQSPWLRRKEQATVAVGVTLALLFLAAYWLVQGGHRGDLIEIEEAGPLEARFRVDVNSAQWPELAQLPEIGEVLARRIVDSRTAQGPFVDHDDLRRVNGIGPVTLERVRPYLLPMPPQSDVAGEGEASPGTL